MKVQHKICILTFVFLNIFLLNLSSAQGQSAPLPIIDFDGTTSYNEFDFAGPNADEVDYDVRYNDTDNNFIKQGETSRLLKWSLKSGQYFGWGVDLREAGRGFDARSAVSLTFWVIGVEGGERFQIKIKDVKGNEPMVKSHNYVKVSKEWQKVCVPLEDFGRTVNLTNLENINLGFNRTISGRRGTIYIDDFKFEFEECPSQ